VAGDLKFELKFVFEIEFGSKLDGFLKCFLKKMLRFPLLLHGGVRGFLILRGLK
jgi:hypothetical protein